MPRDSLQLRAVPVHVFSGPSGAYSRACVPDAQQRCEADSYHGPNECDVAAHLAGSHVCPGDACAKYCVHVCLCIVFHSVDTRICWDSARLRRHFALGERAPKDHPCLLWYFEPEDA